MSATLRRWRERAETELVTLWYVARHPRTPPVLRFLAAGVAAYLLSPIDFIPDAIPIIGYLDDVLVLSAGVYLVMKLTPDAIVAECRKHATDRVRQGDALPYSKIGLTMVIGLWLVAAVLLWFALANWIL